MTTNQNDKFVAEWFFRSPFPHVKEDLVNAISVRAAVGMVFGGAVEKFHHLPDTQMPMAFHVCAGTHPASPRAQSCYKGFLF